MALPQPVNRDLEEALDMLAYILATDSRTSGINWILGDVGMGSPSAVPFGYIGVRDESVNWSTAQGGAGLPTGPTGLDDWLIPVLITVAFQPHQFIAPVTASPPVSSPFTAAHLAVTPPYLEQPGFRTSLQINQKIKGVLRNNITVGGELATTRVTESRYLLQVIQGKLYRASRITCVAQQRRVRGT